MSQPAPTSPDLQQAEKLIAEKNHAEALGILRSYWLANPEDQQAIRLLSRLMKALGRSELSGSLYKLAEHPSAIEHDVQNLFEAGYKLIDARELQLAAMLLQRCAHKMPEQSTVAYELGFALMTLHRFEEAIPHFMVAFKENNDFDTALNLCVCYTLTRRIKEAQELIDKMSPLAKNDEERSELELRKTVLNRLSRFAKQKELTPRDWLYSLYGTLILSEPNPNELRESVKAAASGNGLFEDTAGKSGSNTPDYKAVAWTLVTLQKLLSELGFEFDVVEFYSPLSRPLAEALAHMMDLPAKSFGGTNSADRSLMLMCWAPNIIGPHKNFIDNKSNRILFSYGLSTLQPLPLTPDVVGELCTDCQMPWAQSSEEETDSKSASRIDLPDSYQAKAMDRILEQVSDLESRPEFIQMVEELVAYYEPKRDGLVIGNPKSFRSRPEYTAEIQL